MSNYGQASGTERMAALVRELAFHAEGNVGDGCWDLYDQYRPLADAGAVILLPGELPPWIESSDSGAARHQPTGDTRTRE